MNRLKFCRDEFPALEGNDGLRFALTRKIYPIFFSSLLFSALLFSFLLFFFSFLLFIYIFISEKGLFDHLKIFLLENLFNAKSREAIIPVTTQYIRRLRYENRRGGIERERGKRGERTGRSCGHER